MEPVTCFSPRDYICRRVVTPLIKLRYMAIKFVICQAPTGNRYTKREEAIPNSLHTFLKDLFYPVPQTSSSLTTVHEGITLPTILHCSQPSIREQSNKCTDIFYPFYNITNGSIL